MNNKKIKIICSNNTGIEGDAIQQLKNTSELDGMVYAYGMPDIHPGKGHPIGASFLSKDIIYPYLIGNDIGCGMSLYEIDLKKMKQDKTVKKIKGIELPMDESIAKSILDDFEIDHNYVSSLGTIGGGNHFAEFQLVDQIINEELFLKYNLDKKKYYLLVHSGSRGLGESILTSHIQKYNSKGLNKDNDDFQEYLKKHDYALKWAKANRYAIMYRLAEQLNFNSKLICDIEHNFVEKMNDDLFLHRKGAIPSNKGIIIIPGSRGDYSYIIEPKESFLEDSLFSLSHGAGRKWKRSETKSRLSKKYSVQDLQKTKMGSRVICEDKQLLYEEAPMVYKNISNVINDLEEANLINIIAIMKPFITYKRKKICCD